MVVIDVICFPIVVSTVTLSMLQHTIVACVAVPVAVASAAHFKSARIPVYIIASKRSDAVPLWVENWTSNRQIMVSTPAWALTVAIACCASMIKTIR